MKKDKQNTSAEEKTAPPASSSVLQTGTVMVMLPQSTWEEANMKIDMALNTVEQLVDLVKQALSGECEEKEELCIPLIDFKTDTALQKKYGLTYTQVRNLANNNQLRTYTNGGTRYRWTTHKALSDYFNSVQTAGFKK